MKSALLAAIACSTLITATSLQAQHLHHDDSHDLHHAHETHAAHEHGIAVLRVASADTALLIEFISPLDNLVGFEHPPRTDAQRAALATAEQLLHDGSRLFAFPARAACQLQEVKLESPWPQGEQTGHDHGHENDDKGRAHEDGAGHAELSASYHFECAAPTHLDRLQTKLFETFPRLHAIRAERASASGQGAAVLQPGKTGLPL